MEKVQSFRDLEVYAFSQMLAQQIFEISKSFPREERYALVDQIRRSSRSVGAQVAEAWALRRYENHFISKLSGADGERLETEHWIETARACAYLPDNHAQALQEQCTSIGNMLAAMIRKARWFCTPPPKKQK